MEIWAANEIELRRRLPSEVVVGCLIILFAMSFLVGVGCLAFMLAALAGVAVGCAIRARGFAGLEGVRRRAAAVRALLATARSPWRSELASQLAVYVRADRRSHLHPRPAALFGGRALASLLLTPRLLGQRPQTAHAMRAGTLC